MHEFDIINTYFKNHDSGKYIGDDCAILNIKNVHNLLITSDTLVEGVHFFKNTPASSVGHKALAVNLSDIAAMGGQPKWFTLAMTMPEYNHTWLQEFTSAMYELASKYNITLVGGDLSSGPLSITITALGYPFEPNNKVLSRFGAQTGDSIWVSGSLGEPGYSLDRIYKFIDNSSKNLLEFENLENLNINKNKLFYPEPRINVGMEICKYANSAIDISDGLISDLGHILSQSDKRAELNLENLPFSISLNNLDKNLKYKYGLGCGDEYELLFTAPSQYDNKILAMSSSINSIASVNNIKLTKIGKIINKDNIDIDTGSNNLIEFTEHGKKIDILNILENNGWKHFRD